MVVMDHMAYRNDFPPVSQAPIADNAITTEAVDSIGEVGPHAVQSQDHNADLSDMAFIHMVNNAAHGTGDMLNPWHPNYSVHAGPWNPMAMNNNTQCSTYPTYRPGPFTEPTMQTHHVVDVADHGLSECSSMCSHYHAGPLPSTTIPTVLNTLTPQSIAPGMPAPRRRHSSDISRIRRMSSKSDKLLSPCDICLKQGKGTRIPKNAADQKKHRLTHTRPYACLVPGCVRQPTFATQNDLERHARGCHGIETRQGSHHYYKCTVELCPKRGRIWDRRDNFKQHLQRIHKELNTEQISECLKAAVYHPGAEEIRAYHVTKKSSGSRRHTVSEAAVTNDETSTSGAGQMDAQDDSIPSSYNAIRSSSLKNSHPMHDNALASQFDAQWLQSMPDMSAFSHQSQNVTNAYNTPMPISPSEMLPYPTPGSSVYRHDSLYDAQMGFFGPAGYDDHSLKGAEAAQGMDVGKHQGNIARLP